MIFTDQPPTQFDLRFSLLGIPVRVHPLFWLVALLMGRSEPSKFLVMWIGVMFVSILIHEMGHALAIRRFGWQPNILLYAFGGLAIYRPSRREPIPEMLISLAGPAAGFVFAGAVVALCKVTGHPIQFFVGLPYGIAWIPPMFERVELSVLVHMLLWVNVWWGLVNLLPVFPLDGGQFTRELLMYFRSPDALINSLRISIITAAAVAIYTGLQAARVHPVDIGNFYITIMFGYLAYSSYNMLQSFTGQGRGHGGW